jgi:hypothetical protein
VNESNPPTPSVTDSPPVAETIAEDRRADAAAVDPVRSAAGRLGGQRVHKLAELGRAYEKEHGLKAGRQRLKQLIQLGNRYEVEHGLRAATLRRKRRGNAWQEFLSALTSVVKPAYRPAVEQLIASLRSDPKTAVVSRVVDSAA